VSNSSGTRSELSRVSAPRKLECSVLEFEFLNRFFMDLLLEVLQVIVITFFIYKVSGSILNRFCA
jgi:hypothetical protein